MTISPFYSVTYTGFLLIFLSVEASLSCIVETPSGRIEGKIDRYDGIVVQSYLGIPYAKPPIGDLRFRRPVPLGKWNRTLQATTLPPSCVQYSKSPFPWLADNDLSLDCLFLNIWAPKNATLQNKKTVMFWIHTGGFRIGTSSKDYLDGKVISAQGDVVVVTFNYRLGVEGFYYSETEDAPGNVGK